MRSGGTVLVCILAILSGCAGLPLDSTTPAGGDTQATESPVSTVPAAETTARESADATATETAATAQEPTPTATTVPTATATPVPQPEPTVDTPEEDRTHTETQAPTETRTPTSEQVDNPWGSATITVCVVPTDAAQPRDYQAVGRDVAEFWDRQLTDLTGYEGDVVYAGSSESADILLRPQPTIATCDGRSTRSETWLWCADPVPESGPVYGTVNVAVSSRYTLEDQEVIYRAALGEVFGIDAAESEALDYYDGYPATLADPWPGRNNLTVAVRSADESRNYSALVQEAVTYWETEGAEYRTYNATLTVDPDARGGDIVVTFIDDVGPCSGEAPELTIGCARVLGPGTQASATEYVRIERGYNDESTVDIIRHELGHIYGLGHSAEPPVMQESQVVYDIAEPNATERDNPFANNSIDIHVDYESFDEPDSQVEEQMQHVVEFYSEHGGEYGPNTSFELTESQAEAEIVVQSYGGSDFPCELESGSCYSVRGTDPDGDGAFETYSRMTIAVNLDGTDTLGWHVGTHLGTAFAQYDLPPEFDGRDDDREGWHR